MNEIFQYFADVLLVAMRDALILLLDKFLKTKLGCSLALAISVVCKVSAYGQSFHPWPPVNLRGGGGVIPC